MRPLRSRLQLARRRLGVPWETVERDYLLSWVLAGFNDVDALRETLVFKGGTALKKCYFGDYRFSEDLDFSALAGVPRGRDLDRAIEAACKAAARLLEAYVPAEIVWERYAEREPHPGGQEAFVIRARFPWHREPRARAMIEVSVDERILRPPVRRPVIHEYGEPLEASALVYSLEEVVAEKLRAILQHIRRMEERGWARSRARDYYDLWRILDDYGESIDFSDFPKLLAEKCALKNVSFRSPDDFFQNPMLGYVERTWDQWLGPLVPALPPFERVIASLRSRIGQLLADGR